MTDQDHAETVRLVGGWYRFHESDPERRWSAPDPNDEALGESLHRLRYGLVTATQADAYRVLAAAEAYWHFAAHPARTKDIVAQLRELRRAVKESAEKGKGEE